MSFTAPTSSMPLENIFKGEDIAIPEKTMACEEGILSFIVDFAAELRRTY